MLKYHRLSISIQLLKFLSPILFGLLMPTHASSTESALWQQFKAAKGNGKEPTLPDFSYAGYNYSESTIPDISNWEKFDVRDFGAIANDGKYDDKAIQAAIDAAEVAGEGVITFPSGRFMVSPNEVVGENIFIRSSRIVLKGQGSQSGGTEIFMDKMKVERSRRILEITPIDKTEKTITKVIKNALRETYEITVENASKLNIGQRIIIRSNSSEFAKNYYSPQSIDNTWTRLLNKGFRLREIHTIADIKGNVVHLREPLHISLIINSKPILIKTYNMLNNVGIEDILFKGNWNSYPEEFIHHKNDIHDYAWNAIRIDNLENGWVRNVEFKDWNQGLHIDGGAAITIENISFTGKKGHASVHTRRSYGVLIKDSKDLAGHHHGPGLGYSASGTVYLRYQMDEKQRMDSHSGSPYATLFDNVENGHFYGNGGPNDNYPHHGKYFVAWNFLLKGGPQKYNFWPSKKKNNTFPFIFSRPSKRNGNTFAMPFFIGLKGDPIKMEPGTFSANELPNQIAEPLSLFEAQLKLRLESQTQK